VIFQDFPGHGIKKIQDFPGGVGTLQAVNDTRVIKAEIKDTMIIL